MKAVRITRYGGPEVLEVAEVPTPKPGPKDALIEIHAASLNPVDWKIQAGMLQRNVTIPMPHVMGRDFSGVVIAVGPEAAGVQPGDAVFGMCNPVRDGAQAEYMTSEVGMLGKKPPNVSHGDMASLALVGVSALAAIKVAHQVKKGDKLLVHAGAGGVGSFAIQYAKSLGADVLATSGPQNLDYVRSLGASRAIDYTKEDFTKVATDCDVVFDLMGGEVHRRSFAALKAGGTLVYLAAAPIPDGPPPRTDVTVKAGLARPTPELYAEIARLAASGAVKAQVTQTFALDDAPRAYAENRSGHTRGKIVFKVR
jgi:NADPH:quinone reductase-like Zn-dependent oxidoreductase